MNRLSRLSLAALLLSAFVAVAQAQQPRGTYEAIELIDRPHPQANLFPNGGWTLYPGEAGSGEPSCSPYSAVTAIMPPALYANLVCERLRQMAVPIIPPQTHFLNRNPAIAENVDLPTPRSWLPKEEEEKQDPAANGPVPRGKVREKVDPDKLDPKNKPDEKDKGKDKDKAKDKDKDKDADNKVKPKTANNEK